mgnify:CR=1 FL=1
MHFRRCHALALLPEETPVFSLAGVLAGGTGLAHETRVLARAAHLDEAIVLGADAAALLLACNGETWQPLPDAPQPRARVLDLIEQGLLIARTGEPAHYRDADERVRQGHWWALSAIHHRHSRWAEVDGAGEMIEKQLVTAADLVRALGPPPPEAPPRQAGAIALPVAAGGQEDAVLARRVTCRNYDVSRALPLGALAHILHQVLKAQAVVETAPGVRFLKKNVPSGGSLHPIQAYVIVRNVEGMAPGLYHYHAVAHELTRTAQQPTDLAAWTLQLVSGQDWFASAHVHIVQVCHFERNFWKYRNHAKAYRAVTLDAGHISQALYTAATGLGLGAFVTAAINEAQLESLLSLDPIENGVLAVCGFGWRSAVQAMAEMDPAGRVWPAGLAQG